MIKKIKQIIQKKYQANSFDIDKSMLDSTPVNSNMKLITNFKELDEMVETVNKIYQGELTDINDRVYMSSYKLDINSFIELFGSSHSVCDPFSKDYRDWEMGFFDFISGSKYNSESEGFTHDFISTYNHRPPTAHWDIITRISYMKTYTTFLEICKPVPEMNVLEMGCGWGVLLELFGRCGCYVTGIDASRGFADYTRNMLSMQNIKSDIIFGTFYDIEKIDRVFDIIIFEASFHHTGEPLRLMRSLKSKLSKNGKLFFLNEAFSNDFDRPWGVVRYDGESIFQIRKRGWLEFGYRLDFFIDLLSRTGFRLVNTYPMPNGSELYEVCLF